MARGRSAGGWTGGGGVVEARRPRRARLGTAAGALAGAAALALWAAWTAGRLPVVALVPGAAAVLALAVALWRGWPVVVAWALALLGGGYAVALGLGPERATVDAAAPLVAAALLVVAELAYWSLELRDPGSWEGPLLVRRLVALGALALVSLALGSIVVVVTAINLRGGVALDLIGVAAAVATLGVLAALARRGVARS